MKDSVENILTSSKKKKKRKKAVPFWSSGIKSQNSLLARERWLMFKYFQGDIKKKDTSVEEEQKKIPIIITFLFTSLYIVFICN